MSRVGDDQSGQLLMIFLDGQGLGRNRIGRLVTSKCEEEVYGWMDFLNEHQP